MERTSDKPEKPADSHARELVAEPEDAELFVPPSQEARTFPAVMAVGLPLYLIGLRLAGGFAASLVPVILIGAPGAYLGHRWGEALLRRVGEESPARAAVVAHGVFLVGPAAIAGAFQGAALSLLMLVAYFPHGGGAFALERFALPFGLVLYLVLRELSRPLDQMGEVRLQISRE